MLCNLGFYIFHQLRDVELISVGIRRSNFGFSRVKKIKHSRATVHFFEEESIQKNKSKPGIYYFHVPKQRLKNESDIPKICFSVK